MNKTEILKTKISNEKKLLESLIAQQVAHKLYGYIKNTSFSSGNLHRRFKRLEFDAFVQDVVNKRGSEELGAYLYERNMRGLEISKCKRRILKYKFRLKKLEN